LPICAARLAGNDPTHATVHLQRPDRRDDDRGIRPQPGRPALDVEELLSTEIGAEAGFRHDDVVGRQRCPVRQDRAVAMGDVAEWTAMDKGRSAFQGLEQVRLQRVLEEDGHRARDLEVLGRDRRPILPRCQHDPAEPLPQVPQVGCERKDRHHLGCDGDHELGLARISVLLATQADHDVTESAVADVDDPRPQDVVGVDAQRVAVVDVVVDERSGEVVRRAHRVDVAGEVEVEVLHRNDLAVAAASGPALDPEHRSERRLADRHGRAPADAVQALGKPDGRGRLALSEGCRADRGDDHVLAARAGCLDSTDPVERHLRLGAAIRLDLVVLEPEVPGNVRDRAWLDAAGNLEIGRKRRRGGH
jgi:hypothetical protein